MPRSACCHRIARLLTPLVGVVLVAAGCGDDPAAEPSAAATTSPARPGLEGTWRAGPAAYTAVVKVLQEAGLAASVDAVLQGSTPGQQVTYDLKLQDGSALLSSTVDDRPLGVQDREGYTADGDTLTLAPVGTSCASTFRWLLDGDELTLHLAKDTCPDYQGTPDEAYIRALYTAVPFVRVDP